MLVEAKELSNVSFDTISKGCWPDLLLHYNTQSVKPIPVLLGEKDKAFGGNPSPKFHHPSEILRMVDPLLLCKCKRSFHGEPQYHPCLLCPANRQDDRQDQ